MGEYADDARERDLESELDTDDDHDDYFDDGEY
jgi:hypothetical protein